MSAVRLSSIPQSTPTFNLDGEILIPYMNQAELYANQNNQIHEGTSFPHKLHKMLEKESSRTEGCSWGTSVKWEKHGFTFRIIDPAKFEAETIPKYFKHTKYTSFQRQLNLYGFRRLSKGEDQGSYFHPKFQRNRKDLLFEIKRVPSKSAQANELVRKQGQATTIDHATAFQNDGIDCFTNADDLIDFDPLDSSTNLSNSGPNQQLDEHLLSGDNTQSSYSKYVFDAEKHFAQFDKSEFMALVESVIKDLDGTSATGQLEDLMITSTDQSQEVVLSETLQPAIPANGPTSLCLLSTANSCEQPRISQGKQPQKFSQLPSPSQTKPLQPQFLSIS